MYILSVVPLTKIPRPAPQTLDYFSALKAEVGSIVRVRIAKRSALAVVIYSSAVKQQKQQIKKSHFALRPIEELISGLPIVPKSQIKLALWASAYYYAPAGLMFKSLVPHIFSKPTKNFLKELAAEAAEMSGAPWDTGHPHGASSKKPTLYWHNLDKRLEFYRREIAKAQKNKRSVLFLVPELYKIDYFKNKIPALGKALIVHSKITPRGQYTIWKKSLRGENIILGTRAALAISPRNLGLLIVDEEENPSYKSYDQAPYINARDVAVKLSEIVGAKAVLGTAMPSMESYLEAAQNKYALRAAPRLQNTKYGIKLIDMREELKNGNYSIFSGELKKQLLNTIKNSGQAILFINRRGFSTGLLCRDCGHIVKCQNCDVPLVYHKTYSLICHHCGQKQKPISVCPNCASYKIKFMGAGTQKVEEELKKMLAEHKITKVHYKRVDTDVVLSAEEQKETFDGFRQKKYNILIGTQLMLKEGLLPKVRLVSIITMDPLLSLPDFRVSEFAFKTVDKLWTSSISKIVLQTYIKDAYVFNNVFNKSPKNFISDELVERSVLKLPPFSQLVKLSYSHPNQQRAEQEAGIIKNKLEIQTKNLGLESQDYQILGPAPAFIPRVKNGYIWQFLIKSRLDIDIRNKLLSIVPSDWKIDVDPIETL